LLNQPHALFISDLHLCAARPHTTALLLDFLQGPARDAQSLFILGDLFEYWAGDDDLEAHRDVIQALRALAEAGVQTCFMHGNRDFLIGDGFARASGTTLLQDPLSIALFGWQAVLTHGDRLCTDDVAYQQFRSMVRDPRWQADFLAQPLEVRKAQIAAMRERSRSEQSLKPEDIMDVNSSAVEQLLRSHRYPALLIHGHTHRPGVHPLDVDGRHCVRHVLGDWDLSGSYLRLDADGCSSHRILQPA
jgi:UDP-2,3-diacylglucosamine hydrolase